MQKIIKDWQNFLKEEKQSYEMLCSLKIDEDLQIYGRVFDEIRAIPGITIVKTEKKTQKIKDGTKIATLSIKFLIEPAIGKQYLSFVKEKIRQIRDAEGDKILGIRVIKLPIKV